MITQSATSTARSSPAIVSKAGLDDAAPAEYLQLDEDGAQHWVSDPVFATAFASMRDAMRMALRLPSSVRAFGLPRDVEMSLYQHH
jgi:hypothetical protein